ncbi:MAG: dihydrolipoyl dehydrogenase [Dehalococcoidia bacterium]|nr:MAG: dihydrolipoyl dehydrogenase [Dehalococcoidia bacterium]
MEKKYDVVIIGSGSGMFVAYEAVFRGLSTALVDKGPLGGTCPNLGCIPSKMLMFPADRVVEIDEARKLGIEAQVTHIDFPFIMERMRRSVEEAQSHLRESFSALHGLDFYEGAGAFVGEYELEVGGTRIKGDKFFIATGSRPAVPDIPGLETVNYLTTETLLELTSRPRSMAIIGGGYIGVEYAHFFAAMGTQVTLIEAAERLVPGEEPEVAALLKHALRKRMQVLTDIEIEQVVRGSRDVRLLVKERRSGARFAVTADTVMLATGRRSNADLLRIQQTGVETDERGFVNVNDYLETSKPGMYAVGDANGRYMFRHIANIEATVAARNAFGGKREAMDYSAAPHAVYSYPQIAAVGFTTEEARKGHDILVGRARYMDTATGEAMMETDGFAKAIVEKDTHKILGFHVIGPHAPSIVQEVINAMASGGHITEIEKALHIHPALPELVQAAFRNLSPD